MLIKFQNATVRSARWQNLTANKAIEHYNIKQMDQRP